MVGGAGSSSVFWALAIIQVVGLVSAWAARLSERSPRRRLPQGFFLICLLVVGVATAAAMAVGPGMWMSSGVTLSTMILTVTCDFSRGERLQWGSGE
jgi:hypothetical protein